MNAVAAAVVEEEVNEVTVRVDTVVVTRVVRARKVVVRQATLLLLSVVDSVVAVAVVVMLLLPRKGRMHRTSEDCHPDRLTNQRGMQLF